MTQKPQQETPSERSIWLWPDEEFVSNVDDGFRPWLDPYLVDTDQPRGAVIVFPGGGYGCRVAHESGVIARRFNEGGFHAFVAHYRVRPHLHPGPLRDACRAIQMVRHHASEWGIRPDKIAVCGFSAGGHLAAHAAVAPVPAAPDASDPVARIDARPDAQILCYAVLSNSCLACYANLLGDDATEAQINDTRPDRLVTEATPPAFLWHTADDNVVPLSSTLNYAAALHAAGVSQELHIYPHGVHGIALAPDDPHAATWMSLCCEWLELNRWR